MGKVADAALATLVAGDVGHAHVEIRHGLRETFAGHVEYIVGGWRFRFFKDCGDHEWEYLDEACSPSGERIDYDDAPPDLRYWQPSNPARWGA